MAGSQLIVPSDSTDLLGVTIDKNLNFKAHISNHLELMRALRLALYGRSYAASNLIN